MSAATPCAIPPRARIALAASSSSRACRATSTTRAPALQVRLEELVEPPRRTGRLYKAASLPSRKRGSVTLRRLLPETIAGLEIDRMELPAGASLAGVPHTPGTREYLTCEIGQIEL